VHKNEVQGSIPCYTGFHPHLLNKENKYAVCKLGVDGFLQEIKEKHRYNENPEDNYHSAGTYYFSSGSLVKEVFRELEKRTDLQLNGEWYVSLVYILMLEREMKISVYDRIRHFCQWGTPEDMEEYMAWANIFEIQHYGE
jgi:NDP-sugar pyrophosphorylase family protein